MFKGLNRRAFKVGGCVRDEIWGAPVHDVDYVIEKCGIAEFRGYFSAEEAPLIGTKPNSPPVFSVTDPKTGIKCETALARTEEKVDDTYTGYQFNLNVSIEEDLARRDFTMNSIATHYETGVIIDPFGGVADVKAKILRCINQTAFVEDPLRIYRGARFVPRFGLNVDLETEMLMAENAPNLIHILPERVHLELTKVYKECKKPSSFFYFLNRIDALRTHFKPLFCSTKVTAGPVQWHGGKSAFVHMLDAFDYAKDHDYSFDVALAALFHDTGKGITQRSILPNHHGHEKRSFIINQQYVKQHRFTKPQEEMIVGFGLNHMKFHFIESMTPTRLVRFYRAIKKYAPEYIQAANCDTPLNQRQLDILELTRLAIKDTSIDIPKGCKDIPTFVENKFAETLRRMLGK